MSGLTVTRWRIRERATHPAGPRDGAGRRRPDWELPAVRVSRPPRPRRPVPQVRPPPPAPQRRAPGRGVRRHRRVRPGCRPTRPRRPTRRRSAWSRSAGWAREKGTTDALRTLAGRVTSEGRALDEQIRTLATAQGLTLSDDVGAQIQGVLNDLQARSGQPFDQAWLRAVGDLVEQGRAAANAVLSSPDASDEAKAAARDALARLDALAAAIRDAAGAAGAGTPNGGERGHGRPGRAGAGAARRAGRAGRRAAGQSRAPAAPPCVDRGACDGANAASGALDAPDAAFAASRTPARRAAPGIAVWAAAGAGVACVVAGCCWPPPGRAGRRRRGAGGVRGRRRRRVTAAPQHARRAGGARGAPPPLRSGRHGPRRRRAARPRRQRPGRPHRHRTRRRPRRPRPAHHRRLVVSRRARRRRGRARRCWPGTSTRPRPGSGRSRCSATSAVGERVVLRGADGRPARLPGDRRRQARQGRAARRPVRPRRAAPPRAGHLRRPVRPGDPALHRQRRSSTRCRPDPTRAVATARAVRGSAAPGTRGRPRSAARRAPRRDDPGVTGAGT